MTSRSHSDVELILAPSPSGGSLTQGKKTAAASTVFDSDLPEAYSTLDTAQREHAEYNSNQVKNPENSASNGTPNQAGDDPLYEFDGIVPPEGSVAVGGSEGGSGGGVIVRPIPPEPPSSLPRSRRRLEAKNVLYEDNEISPDSLKHRSLRGNSYSVQKGKMATSYITFRCRTKSLVVAFFIALALILAVSSLALTTLLWFGVYDASPSPSSPSSPLPSPTPRPCDCPSQAEIEELSAAVARAERRVEELENNTASIWNERASFAVKLSFFQSNVSRLSDAVDSLPTERSVTVPSFDMFQGCTTREDESISCTIPDVPSGATHEPCLTPQVPLDEEGQRLMSAECRKTGPHALPEGERVVATLEVFRHTDGVYYMRCRCSRLLDTPDEDYDRSIDHSCSLRETRCPLFMSINASLAWQV